RTRRFDEERVLHIASRMIWREIEGGEVVPVVLDLGTLRHGESTTLEHPSDVVQRAGQGMEAAWLDRDASGQGQVERLRPTRLRVCRQSGLCVRKARLGELLEGIHFLPERPALIGRYVGDGLEEIGDASALSAEELDAKTFDLLFG